MADPDWRAVADRLAERLRPHANAYHEHTGPAAGCPACDDRAAYTAYLEAAGLPNPAAAEPGFLRLMREEPDDV